MTLHGIKRSQRETSLEERDDVPMTISLHHAGRINQIFGKTIINIDEQALFIEIGAQPGTPLQDPVLDPIYEGDQQPQNRQIERADDESALDCFFNSVGDFSGSLDLFWEDNQGDLLKGIPEFSFHRGKPL
jgi:hypothetical protein